MSDSKAIRIFICTIFIWLYLSAGAQNLIVNGSMNSQKGENTMAPRWQAVFLSPDVNDANGTLQTTPGYNWVGTPIPSPDGGTWQNVFDAESFGQTISGLTIGQTYYFRYYYSPQAIAAGNLIFTDVATPNVTITGATGYSNPTEAGTLFNWYTYYGALTATATSITIEVSSQSLCYLAYDGFYLSATPLNIPTIVQQPQSDLVCNNGAIDFTIQAEKTNGYQWQENKGSGWVDLTDNSSYVGTSTNTLHIAKASFAMNQYQYRCRIFNEYGGLFSSPATITVTDPVTPALSISSSARDICEGTTVIFNATPVDAGASLHFQWSKNGISAGKDNITYQDNNLKDGDVINCVLTTDNNCVTTNTAISNSIVIKVNTAVIPAVTITASANNVCSGTPVLLTAQASNAGLHPSYQWIKNGVVVGSNSASYADSRLSDHDEIQCILLPDLSCVTTKTVKSNTVVMAVTSLVTPEIAIHSDMQAVCAGMPVKFYADVSNADAAFEYTWAKNGVYASSLSIYADSALTSNDVITCTLHANGKCLSVAEVESKPLSIKVFENPVVMLNHQQFLCNGESRKLEAGKFISYLWNDGSTSSTLTIDKKGVYYVAVTDEHGCTSSDTTTIDAIMPLPAAFLPSDTALCSYSSLVVRPGRNYRSYLWNNDALSPSIEIKKAGLYWLEVKDENGCTGRDTITVAQKDCIAGFYAPSAFTPNHDGKNDLFKPLLFGIVKQYRLEVFNRWGQPIFTTSNLHQGWNGYSKDGMQLNSETYVWRCMYQFENEAVHVQSGTVVLMK